MKQYRKKGILGAEDIIQCDRKLLFTIIMLLSLGFIMVFSASIEVADQSLGSPFHYAYKQIFALSLGAVFAITAFNIPITYYQQKSKLILLIALVFLVLVLVPGIGRIVNGSRRWISLGFMAFQISELAKLAMIIYLANHLSCKQEHKLRELNYYIMPFIVLCLVSFLIMLQPDFGATFVITTTCLLMLFLSELPLKYFFSLLFIGVVSLAVIAVSAPYRIKRLTSFLDPWEKQYDSGYQLTQSLIAFGRGQVSGTGLGSGIQKLFFLPESHTDFLFAVLAEELGLIGSSMVLILFAFFVFRGMLVAQTAKIKQQKFASYLAYGITLWLGLQAIVSTGVNTGMLPTKGLTLPFMSYGGSSLLIVMLACGILLRISRDNKSIS